MASKKGKTSAGRVRGITSSVDDITLRASGHSLRLELGAALIPTPKLTRTIDGASTVEFVAEDPERRLLRHLLVSQKWDAELDGLHFRYPGACSKQGDELTLTLEDRWVAILREHLGPKRAFRSKMTRAEFIKMLVEEAAPHIDFYCPQLHRIQPIKTKAQAKKAKKESEENLGKGIGDVKHLKVKGEAATKAQIELGERSLEIAASQDAPESCQVALVAALIAECGMEDNGNVLGATDVPVGSVEDEVTGFLTGEHWTIKGGAIGYARAHPNAKPSEIAQAVQRAEIPTFSSWEAEAKNWVDAYGGGEGDTSIDLTQPYEFKVNGKLKGKKRAENYWEAIQRLAKEVNWRAFIVGSKFFYMPEPEMLQGTVRLAIDGSTPGIEDVNFEYDGNATLNNGESTEVEVEAFVSEWGVPPGAVFTLADYGPASIGFGDAPKGKIGLSNARNARTGEGTARYLVAQIDVPLSDDPAQRLATITGKKPTAPLPEPAATTITGTGASGSAPMGIQKAIEECDRIDAQHYPYSTPGARGTPPPAHGPYDCSGVTSRIAYVASGEPATTLASLELAQSFQPGEGEWLTIFAKGPDGPQGHAFLRIRTADGWKYFGTPETNPGGGAGWVDDSAYSASYLNEFQKRHPKGF